MRSCFAMTEPEVAGSDPTLMQTRAVRDGDEWVINGHKWFISGARGAQFAILLARTEDDPEVPQAATSAFIVDIPSPGWELVRDVETMAGSHNHCEIRITDLRVPDANMLGDRGQGHRLGPVPAGPGPPGALHAVARADRDGPRPDGGRGPSSATRTGRTCPRSRASSG